MTSESSWSKLPRVSADKQNLRGMRVLPWDPIDGWDCHERIAAD